MPRSCERGILSWCTKKDLGTPFARAFLLPFCSCSQKRNSQSELKFKHIVCIKNQRRGQALSFGSWCTKEDNVRTRLVSYQDKYMGCTFGRFLSAADRLFKLVETVLNEPFFLSFSNDPARASKPLEAFVELLSISICIESMVTSPTMNHLTFGRKRKERPTFR